jgi:transcriptional regulator with XRE-family HTH domain
MSTKPKSERSQLGKELLYMRKKAGLTQRQVRDAIGVDDQYLSRAERGYKTPKISTLQKLADFYGWKVVVTFVEKVNDTR